LRAALIDPSPLVTGRAAEALGLIGDAPSAPDIGKLVSASLGAVSALGPDESGYPLDPAAEAFRLGVYALARLKAYDSLSAAVLAPDGQPRIQWWPVAYALQRVEDKRALIVNTHLCWSKCADSQADIDTGKSWQRDAQARVLIDWIDGLGVNSIILAGDFDLTPIFPQYELFASYTDAWKLGLQLGTATAAWSDRNEDGVPDMPLGDLTTRTHDTRRIDYVFLRGAVGLTTIDLPDLRQPCALVDGQCPAVQQRWAITDDLGVRPSDHNWLRATMVIY